MAEFRPIRLTHGPVYARILLMSLEEDPIEPTINIEEIASDPWPPALSHAELAKAELRRMREIESQRSIREVKRGTGEILDGVARLTGGVVGIGIKVVGGLIKEGSTVVSNIANKRPLLDSIRRRG